MPAKANLRDTYANFAGLARRAASSATYRTDGGTRETRGLGAAAVGRAEAAAPTACRAHRPRSGIPRTQLQSSWCGYERPFADACFEMRSRSRLMLVRAWDVWETPWWRENVRGWPVSRGWGSLPCRGAAGGRVSRLRAGGRAVARWGWPAAPFRANRTPQKPHNFATRRPIPTGIPRTKRHTPVHLLCVLKARRTAGQQRRCA